MGIMKNNSIRKGLACSTVLAASLGALSVATVPATASPFCKCEVVEGPFKTWVLLDDRIVALVDCRTGEVIGRVDLLSDANSIATCDDRSVVYVGTIGNPDANKPPSICDIDCETFEIIDRPIPAPVIPNGLICKGDFVIFAMENGQVGFLDRNTGEFRFVDVAGRCNTILSKCDGSTIFVGTEGDPATGKGPGFCDIDCETLQVIERRLPVPPIANGFWLSPDNRWLWIMLQDFSVAVFDCQIGQLVAVVPVGGSCNSIKGKCDGSRVFVGTVGGDVQQAFFPPIGFGQSGTPGGQDFVVDSFFDVTYQIEIEVPGQPPILFDETNPLRGDAQLRRGNPQRDHTDPNSHAVMPIEMVGLNLQGQSPQGVGVQMIVAPDMLQGGGQVVGGGTVFQGDLPAQPVDSFFDIAYRLRLIGPDGEAAEFMPEFPIPHQLDPLGPPLEMIPFGCDKWRVPQDIGAGIPLFQDPENFNPDLPDKIVVRCDVICFPPPPPPKEPGVCDIPLGSFLPVESDLPAPPIPCGITVDALTGNIWVAMQNGTVGVWDCDWNPIIPDLPVGGGCTTIDFKPDFSALFVGTAGNPLKMRPPGICDIDPVTFEITENPLPGVPQPKGIEFCQTDLAPICFGDCNGDGRVDFADLVRMLGLFGTAGGLPGCDANNDGVVNFADLVTALGLFGPCP